MSDQLSVGARLQALLPELEHRYSQLRGALIAFEAQPDPVNWLRVEVERGYLSVVLHHLKPSPSPAEALRDIAFTVEALGRTLEDAREPLERLADAQEPVS